MSVTFQARESLNAHALHTTAEFEVVDTMTFDNGRLLGTLSIRFKISGEERQLRRPARLAVAMETLLRRRILARGFQCQLS